MTGPGKRGPKPGARVTLSGRPMKKRGAKPRVTREQLLRFAGQGTTRPAAAAELGMTEGGLYGAERRHNIWLHPLPEDVGRWVAQALRDAGASNYLIMTVLQRSEMTVSRYLRDPGWVHGAGTRRAPGFNAVAALLGSGLTDEQIAAQTGLALETVRQYLRHAARAADPAYVTVGKILKGTS